MTLHSTARAAAFAEPAPIGAREADLGVALGGLVRVLTCGSVDDGKSTLIGRLLWDCSDLFEDQRAAVEKNGLTAAGGKHLDYSLLVDGLIAEREQGITIDIAWRYFDTAERRFVLIDSPGHEQYTRNMASGASHADVAVMLVDARHGLKAQTRRHAALLDLFGVRNVVLAVNKMDLVDYARVRFADIASEFAKIAAGFSFRTALAIPVSAVAGDNVAGPSLRTPWYRGPSLIEALGAAAGARSRADLAFRMPVQHVARDGQDFRGLAGTVASGTIAVGDGFLDAVSGQAGRVARIATMDGDRDVARAGDAVIIVPDRDLDLSRGAVLSATTAPATASRALEARLVWLSERPFDPSRGYLMRTATDLVPVSRLDITERLDLASLASAPATSCATNDIVAAALSLARAVSLDAFADLGGTGSLLIVDAIDGATVAGGVVVAAHAATGREADDAEVIIDAATLAAGLCRDLGDGPDDAVEFQRRAREVELLLQRAGVRARVSLTG
ncbi:MAG: GTP-binding protein [Hyphomicrobiaceae bacterium]|nr:GTP-binding protein [Hyphomicrobiaceae bacterium]